VLSFVRCRQSRGAGGLRRDIPRYNFRLIVALRALPFRTLTADEQAQLAARIGNGDRDAEAEFAAIFGPRVAAVVAHRLPDRAAVHDVTQDTLVTALLALRAGKVDDSEKLAAFVYGVVRNLTSNYRRTQQRGPSAVALEADMLIADPVPELESLERRRLAEQAVSELPPLEREVLRLTLRDGLEPSNIAALLGVTAETVRTRKSRALKRLVEMLRAASRSGCRELPSQ
jgi:RNA polymerase sigma factor (sigma-70 family)